MAPLTLLSRRAMALSLSTATNSCIGDVASSQQGIARVVLKRGKAQLFLNGSPMVYSGAIDRIIGRPPPETGDLVVVTNGAKDPIAWGVYNSTSMFRVRVLQTEDDATRDPKSVLNMERLIKVRLTSALKLRRSLGLPSKETNVYRLVNSEGDRLSGLVVDVFGDHVVVATSAAWAEIFRPRVEAILEEILGNVTVIWRPSVDLLREEGLVDVETSLENKKVKVLENGISYRVCVGGQKTGFYADQRENRGFLGSLCHGKDVLDLCCYSGGFALNAANAGANNVHGVDSSASAIELARANAELNKLPEESITFEKADIVQYMRGAAKDGKSWDVVVLDPPKLAPSRKALEKASIKYKSLNAMAMQLLKPGGFLMTCSCSGAMTQSHSFLSILQDAASSAGRRVSLLRSSGAGPDHPLDPAYPEGSYLTNYLFQIM